MPTSTSDYDLDKKTHTWVVTDDAGKRYTLVREFWTKSELRKFVDAISVSRLLKIEVSDAHGNPDV
jgi:hypothetical protein